MKYIIQDLLLGSLVSMGSLLCAVIGGLCGAATSFALNGQDEVSIAVGALCGFSVGIMAGSASVGVISSGVKTILMCWAESPQKLANSHPDIHEEFVKRINNEGASESESDAF